MRPGLYRRIKMPFRRALGNSPWIYCTIARLKTGRNREVVSRSSDILIESFPRSGTTFMVANIKLAAPSLRVASHVHHQAHVKLAARYGVPSFVLIRDPIAACLSATVRLGDQVPFEQMVARWCAYYEQVETTPRVRFVTFESLTEQTHETVRDVLESAGLADRLVREVSEEEALAEVAAMGERRRRGVVDPIKVSIPTAERKARIEEFVADLDQSGPLFERARAIHDRILAR